MARNALMPQMQMYEAPAGPNISTLINPLMQGIQRGDTLRQQGFQNERALTAEARQGEQLQLAKNADARAGEAQRMAKERAEVERLGKLAQVIHDDPNDATASQRWQGVIQGNPQMGELLQKYGVNPRDHRTGAKFLMAEVGAYKSSAEQEMERLKMGVLRNQSAAGALDLKLKQRELDSPASKLTIIPEGGVLVGTDPRTGQSQEIARGNDKAAKPPAGYRATADGNMEAIPGGPADIKQNEKRQQDYASATQVIQQLDELARSVNRVATSKGLDKNFGVQGYVPNMPGGDAANAYALLDTLKTQGAFAALQEMRNASKTGGALGAISDREGQMLQNAMAPLGKAQSPQQVRQSLQTILDHIEASKARIRDAYNDHWNRNGAAARQEMGGPARIRDDSDYARLPSGAQYIDPEGNVRTKR